MAKILITGGAGFIGSQLGYYLNRLGDEVFLLDNMNHGHKDNLEIDGKGFGWFIDDDIRRPTLLSHVSGMDYVIHLAGLSSLPLCQSQPQYAIDVNVAGTANVLEACRLANVKKVIFASTGAIYENNTREQAPFSEDETEVNPYLVYPTSKYQAELLCDSFSKCYGMDIIKLRFFNVYGPHQDFKRKQPPFTGYLLKQLMNGEDLNVFSDGEQRRDYVHVIDLAELIGICLGNPSASNQTFNVSSGRAYSVNEIANTMMDLFDIKVNINYQDSKIYWDKYPVLHQPKEFNIDKQIVVDEVNKYVLGCTKKTEELLSWKARVSLEQGLKTLVDYARKIS